MTRTVDSQSQRRFERALGWTVATFFALVSLSYIPAGHDIFRFPKLLLLRTEGILLIGLIAVAIILQKAHLSPLLNPRGPAALGALFLLWGGLAAALSTDPGASLLTLVSVASAIAVCVAAYLAAPSFEIRHLHLISIVAAIQAAMVALQNAGIWFPFILSFEKDAIKDPTILRVAPIAFLGNRNDVGVYLAIPVLFLVALYVFRRLSRSEWLVGLLIIGGLIGSYTMTAIGSVGISVVGLLAWHFRKWSTVVIGCAFGAFFLIVITSPPLRSRAINVRHAVATGDYDSILTNRMAAFLTAGNMILDDPLTGSGPGMFAANYFEHKIEVSRKWQSFRLRSEESFAETHNDHLQVAAEYGLPGYLLLLAASVLFLQSCLRGRQSERSSFARIFALPLVSCIAVLAMAQFPLYGAASGSMIAILVGTLWRWSEL